MSSPWFESPSVTSGRDGRSATCNRPQLTGLLKPDYDWTDDVRGLPMPVLIVAGDADGLPPRHAVEFFELLGGGKRDAVWDRSGMTRHGVAILPRATHYDINVAPAIATSVASFLDEV